LRRNAGPGRRFPFARSSAFAQVLRKLLFPVVKTFFPIRSGLHVTPERIDLARPSCSDRIANLEEPATRAFTRLDELWSGEGGAG
jgi:hypothetical protein